MSFELSFLLTLQMYLSSEQTTILFWSHMLYYLKGETANLITVKLFTRVNTYFNDKKPIFVVKFDSSILDSYD